MKLTNPVLPGFHADPSMIRVGDTYYIANSTFEWWPGVRLHKSTDMQNWETLPNPLNRVSQLDMRGNPASGGIWAPDLSYADGKFWLIYTDVKIVNGAFKDMINYLVTTENPESGVWSEPIKVNGVGFDASLFHDDDGRKYLVQQTWDHREYHHPFDGITLTEFDVETMKLMPETARKIWDGTAVQLEEGPHLYKINGYYYLFAAEGGTVWTHQESVARSKTLDEMSFETMPNNPLIGNLATPLHPLQKQGHGALVDTPSGEWYYASLVARPLKNPTQSGVDPRGWSPLGRETSIQKVEWDVDSWPYIVGGQGGTVEVEGPKDAKPSVNTLVGDFSDDFSGDELNMLVWNTLREPFSEVMGSVGNGNLTLIGQGSLANNFDLSLVARRWQAHEFDANVRVAFDPFSYQQMAGLTNFYNDTHFSSIFVTWNEINGRVIEVAENNKGAYTSFLKDDAIPVPSDIEFVDFKVEVRGLSYTYLYSFDGGATWQETGVTLSSHVLSDEYINMSYGGFFTGAFVGLYATDYSGYGAAADFKDFNYKELT
jgi:xylan 1,4-beta-xylosidase